MQEQSGVGAVVPRNEIVVYQPDAETRIAVKFDGDTVWLSQEQMIELFQRDRSVISRHINNAIKEGEVEKDICLQILQTNAKGRPEVLYNLEVVTSVGYRVKSFRGVLFRRWANHILKEYLTRGHVLNGRVTRLESRMDEAERRLDMFVRSALPAPEQIFMDGQFLDAHVEIVRLIRIAKKRVVLIDNFIDDRVFVQLAERGEGVSCTIYSRGANKQSVRLAATRYSQQYPTKPVSLVFTGKTHDRFLIIDDVVWHLGASPKDAGARIFAMMKMTMKPETVLCEI